MCGRFQLEISWAELVALYNLIAGELEPWDPSWSVCPTQRVPTLLHSATEGRALALRRWGFPMPWLAKDGGDPWSRPLLNAKSEEVLGKRTWTKPMRVGRAVVPATAFVEWIREGKRAWPVRFAPTEGPLLHMAALTASFEREGAEVGVVAILTTAASPDLAGVHDRMPALLHADQLGAWLDPSTPTPAAHALLAPAPAGWLRLEALPTSMNKTGAVFAPPGPADWSLAEHLGR